MWQGIKNFWFVGYFAFSTVAQTVRGTQGMEGRGRKAEDSSETGNGQVGTACQLQMNPARPSAGTKISSRQAAKSAKKARPDLCLTLGDLRVFARDISRSTLVAYDVASELSGNPFQLLRVSNADERSRARSASLRAGSSAGTKINSHKGTKPQRKDRIQGLLTS